jgi:hypothetical protein
MKEYAFIVLSANKRHFEREKFFFTDINAHAERIYTLLRNGCWIISLAARVLRNAYIMKGNKANALDFTPNALQILVWPCAAFMIAVRENG